MNELFKRSLTGIVFIVLVIISIFIHPWLSGLLFLLITVLALNEFYSLVSTQSLKPYRISGIISGAGLFLCFFIYGCTKGRITLFPYILFFLLFIIAEAIFRKENFLPGLAVTLAGILYVALPLSLINVLLFPFHLQTQYTPHLAAGYFFILWSFDTGAYVTGKPFGRHKMVPGISPAKSWEGFAGGILISALVCYITGRYYTELTRSDWYVMLLIIIVMGTAGDLFESLLKRIAAVKDSGKLMPGHGGLLDRFDSVFLSLPVFVIYYIIKYNL